MNPNARYSLTTMIGLAVVLGAGGCRETPQRDVTLRVWHTESDPAAQKALAQTIRQFEDAHPGAKVQQEGIAWGALSQKLTVALATGDTPDLVHLQPFMAASMWKKNLLLPIDDVIAAIGQDDIYPAVRDLQMFEGRRYGIAYALGTTFYTYRMDWAAEQHLAIPATWAQYLRFVAALAKDTNGDGKIDRYGVILPGGSPFFMDQFMVELVASNGGRLFESNGRPTFTEKPVLETLDFLAQLVRYAPPDWTSEEYTTQFRSLAAGKGATVPVTYARAARQIAQDAPSIADPEHFAVMTQPVGPSGTQSVATLDGEPLVLLRSSKSPELAKEFLKAFYQPDNYLRFTSQVPIHLTPVTRSLAESDRYMSLPFVIKWKPWQEESFRAMRDGRTRPIFLAREHDRLLPFLMELQGARILTDMVMAVTLERRTPAAAAAEGQKKAEDLIERLGFKTW